jgi:hypothetical protein
MILLPSLSLCLSVFVIVTLPLLILNCHGLVSTSSECEGRGK